MYTTFSSTASGYKVHTNSTFSSAWITFFGDFFLHFFGYPISIHHKQIMKRRTNSIPNNSRADNKLNIITTKHTSQTEDITTKHT